MNKVSKETIIRTIVLFVTLLNTILTSSGKNPLPFSDEELYTGLSTIATTAAAIWAWWKNNSFTKEAVEADKIMHDSKKNKV